MKSRNTEKDHVVIWELIFMTCSDTQLNWNGCVKVTHYFTFISRNWAFWTPLLPSKRKPSRSCLLSSGNRNHREQIGISPGWRNHAVLCHSKPLWTQPLTWPFLVAESTNCKIVKSLSLRGPLSDSSTLD